MARMIPPVFLGSSPGERLLFERFQADPGTDKWIVLHSVELAQHTSQIQGEIDFVVIAPGLGVLCLEVKGHSRAAVDENGWRLGNAALSGRSPFKQAADGMFSLRKFLRGTGMDLRNIPIWSAVWFTHVRPSVRLNSPEWMSWQLLDRHDVSRPVSVTITHVLENARDHLAASLPGFRKSAGCPTQQQSAELAARIRPRAEFALSKSDIRLARDQERDAFVTEQYEALDVIEDEPRVLFTGPAGSGKTFLAVESACRSSMRGQRVQVVCYNQLLGGWLARKLADRKNVTASTFHSAMLRIAATPPPEPATSTWWQENLPDLALAQLLNDSDPADLLIVDEIQDLCTPAYLDVLDLMVKGGLAAGRWLMFGDFEKQAIYGHADGRSLLEERAPSSYKFRLYRNCRNTPRIGFAAAQAAGLGNVYRGFRRPDTRIDPEVLSYETPTEQARKLSHVLDKLRADNYSADEIVILSPLADGPAAQTGPPALRRQLAPYGTAPDKIGYTTIHSFKGLDAPAVVVTDINHASGEQAEALLYVAFSRGCDRLVVLAHREATKEMAANLLKGYPANA